MRRRLSWLIGAWLACFLAGLATPVVIAASGRAVVDDDCGCPNVAPGQMCPMHHHSRKAKDDGTCKMRSACQPPDAALLPLSGGLGVLPGATEVVTVFVPGERPTAASSPTIVRSRPPDSPPPRS
jgi:hypothetical protein